MVIAIWPRSLRLDWNLFYLPASRKNNLGFWQIARFFMLLASHTNGCMHSVKQKKMKAAFLKVDLALNCGINCLGFFLKANNYRTGDWLWMLRKVEKRMQNIIWLASWELLARPKIHGGWGINNIYDLGTTIALKSLWRSLYGNGLWSSVMKQKIPSWCSNHWLD